MSSKVKSKIADLFINIQGWIPEVSEIPEVRIE